MTDAQTPTRGSRIGIVLLIVVALCLGAVGSSVPATAAPLASAPVAAGTHPVMADAVLTPADLAGWYRSTGKINKATVSIDVLAQYFIEEGNDEGVAGDIAFAQSIVETGYFTFPAGQVLPAYNNFAGLGAVDGGSTPAQFPDARTGVRAQIQHLRAYGDPTVTVANLAHPLVDPRFQYVIPKGKAPLWEDFGGGIWATDPDYATKVLTRYAEILDWARLYGPDRFDPHPDAAHFVDQGFRDLLFRSPSWGEHVLWVTVLEDGAMTPEAFLAELFRGEGAQTAQPVTRMYGAALGRGPDRGGLEFWTRQRKAGMRLERLAEMLMGSSEFENRYGNPSNAEFVRLLYLNVLGREPESAGYLFWTARLDSGAITRAGLLVQFSESSENQRRQAPVVEATVVFLGMVRTARLDPDDLAWWQAERAAGERLEGLIFHVLKDDRYLARF